MGAVCLLPLVGCSDDDTEGTGPEPTSDFQDFGADARFVQGEDNSRRQEYDLLFRSARKVGFQPV